MVPAKKETLLFTIAYTVCALTLLVGCYRLFGPALILSLLCPEKKKFLAIKKTVIITQQV